MRIAFDGKRAYQNSTGLGNYSRLLINQLSKDFPRHEYFVAAPKRTELFRLEYKNQHNIFPRNLGKILPGLWRSNWMKKDLLRNNIDLYHGLSNEIPVGLHKTGIKSVVTIHDLIFERFPEQYKKADVLIYRKKFKYACANADKIIATSQQTKADILELYKIQPEKIEVCYQSCDPGFSVEYTEMEKQEIKRKYALPESFFLYVGSVIERKNLLILCKAINNIKNNLQVPLLVIGSLKGTYAEKVRNYIKENRLQDNIILMADKEQSIHSGFKSSKDLPAIYQSALALVYPSVYEGFGIPVLEAMMSKIPVISSSLSCLPEVGGDACLYVDPLDEKALGQAILRVASEKFLRMEMIEKGTKQAEKFSAENCAARVMQVYKSI